MSKKQSAPEPIGKIAPQPWMTAPETRAVVEVLAADGTEVRFVGGCVRDSIARRPVGDIDIATPRPPEDVMTVLGNAGVVVIPTGLDHGTVTAVVGKRRFEVTSLRIDVETDGRRARVSFTDDWVADAARRDFTFNALSCTPDGDIYDSFGGLEDLAYGRVRFVGTARARIEEDVLRLLRYFRFYGHYGKPPPDRDALAACRALAHRLGELSGERVRGEMFRILASPNPASVIMLMRGERVLENILPEAGDVGRLRLLNWLETRAVRLESVVADPLRRLASLLTTTADGARIVARRLRLSRVQTERLVTLAHADAAIEPGIGDPALRRALQRQGAEIVRDSALLNWAAELAIDPRQPPERNPAWRALLESAARWRPLKFPLKGRDALALGVAPGKRVGQLLAAVAEWWEDGDYRADREACLARLKTIAENAP